MDSNKSLHYILNAQTPFEMQQYHSIQSTKCPKQNQGFVVLFPFLVWLFVLKGMRQAMSSEFSLWQRSLIKYGGNWNPSTICFLLVPAILNIRATLQRTFSLGNQSASKEKERPRPQMVLAGIKPTASFQINIPQRHSKGNAPAKKTYKKMIGLERPLFGEEFCTFLFCLHQKSSP